MEPESDLQAEEEGDIHQLRQEVGEEILQESPGVKEESSQELIGQYAHRSLDRMPRGSEIILSSPGKSVFVREVGNFGVDRVKHAAGSSMQY